MRFDKDVRSLSTHLAGQTSLGVREKFTRLQQISYVLNLDSVSALKHYPRPRKPRDSDSAGRPDTVVVSRSLLAVRGRRGRV